MLTRGSLALGGLHKLARLDTAVTVVDAANLLDNFSTAHNLSDRWKADTTLNPEDERTVTDLLVDQIEFADVIVLNKLDMVDEQTKDKVVQIVKQLNPVAKTIEAQYSKVDVKEIINTGRFDYMKAASGSGWLQSLHEMTQRDVGGKTRLAPKPETEE
jgi:G3E family GTPase